MDETEIVAHASRALLLILVLSLPPIVVASLVGIFVALIQALTQLQEQTISFAVKLVAIMIVIFVTMGSMGAELMAYATQAFHSVARVR